MGINIIFNRKLIKVLFSKKQKKIIIPKRVKIIGDSCFAAYKNLEEVVLPNGLERIEDKAFVSCHNLKKINLPETLLEIRTGAFWECESLENIVVPQNINSINNKVFSLCKNLKTVTLSQTINSIGYQSFYCCSNLEEINFPNDIFIIQNHSFEGCSKLKEIIIPEGVEIIQSEAFADCKNLKFIKLPSTLKQIGNSAFFNCEEIKRITLGNFLILGKLSKIINKMKYFYINLDTNEILCTTGKNKQEGNYKRINYNQFIDNENLDKIQSILVAIMFELEEYKKLKYLKNIIPVIAKHIVNEKNYSIIAEKLKNNSKEFSHFVKRTAFSLEDSQIMKYDVFKLAYSLGAFNDNQIERQKACEFLYKVYNRNPNLIMQAHSMFDSLKFNLEFNKEWAEFFMDNKNFEQLIELEKKQNGVIARIYNNFNAIKEFGRSNRGCQHYRKVTIELSKEYLKSMKFDGIDSSNIDIAETISKFTRSQSAFEDAKQIRRDYLELKEQGKIQDHLVEPDVLKKIEEERNNIMKSVKSVLSDLQKVSNYKLTWEFLSKYDPENFVLGKYCCCCAHLEGSGSGIMRASILHPDCQNLVIKDDDGNIIAKSTLYINREQGYGVFNNIEINTNITDKDTKLLIYDKYIEAIQIFVMGYNKENPQKTLRKINIGMNLNDLSYEIKKNHSKSLTILKGIDFSIYGGYRGDWQEEQYTLWSDTKKKK